MANSSLDFIKDVLAAPLGELIASVGQGVAEAQAALDAASLAQTLEIYSQGGDAALQQLRDIGYQPTYYVLPETECETTISLSISGTAPIANSRANVPVGIPRPLTTSPLARRTKVYVSPLNASNTNKFNMNVNAATKLKFKIVPVPPAESVADIRVVPNVLNESLDKALELLDQFGLDGETTTDSGTGNVIAQSLSGGALAKAGDIIVLTLA